MTHFKIRNNHFFAIRIRLELRNLIRKADYWEEAKILRSYTTEEIYSRLGELSNCPYSKKYIRYTYFEVLKSKTDELEKTPKSIEKTR